MPRRVSLPRAGIYARISHDPRSTEAGVTRQLAECKSRADQLGWTVATTYVDNDASAYSGRTRPEYRQMLADLSSGQINAVIAWHPDRLYRRLDDLAEFADLCKAHNVAVSTVQTGHIDLGSPTGRMIAGMLGVAARYESEHKAERVRSAATERARNGLHHGGQRPFGYEPDGMTLRKREARIVADMAARFLAGESLSSLARWLTESAIPTVSGRTTWQISTVRQMLNSARLSGQVEHHGEIIGTGKWPAILTPDQTQAIRAVLSNPARRQNRPPRRYLLAGLLRCHRCGSTLVGDPKANGRRYACKKSHNRPNACASVTIKADPIEAAITEAVLQRLDTEHLSKALQRRKKPANTSALGDEVAALRTLETLTDMLGDGTLSRAQYERATGRARRRLNAARAAQANTHSSHDITAWATKPGRLRRQWPSLEISRQSAIIAAILDHATIGPATPGARSVNLDRIQPVWRL